MKSVARSGRPRSSRKSDKPVTEIGSRAITSPDALENDLRECLKLASEAADVKIWMRRSDGGKRMRYGFYREAWVTGALDFLDRTDLPGTPWNLRARSRMRHNACGPFS